MSSIELVTSIRRGVTRQNPYRGDGIHHYVLFDEIWCRVIEVFFALRCRAGGRH